MSAFFCKNSGRESEAGLPDGLFSNQKVPIWVNFGGSCTENLGTFWSILLPLEIFYGHLVYFVVIWYIFPRFGILYQEKSGNPGL
jgi:hypothetical protein